MRHVAGIVIFLVLILLLILRSEPTVDRLSDLHRETQQAFDSEPTADVIRSRIIPQYREARVDISGEREQEYLDLMTAGWQFAADALDGQSIVLEAKAFEHFQLAQARLRALGGEVDEPPIGMREEVSLLLLADSKVDERLRAVVDDGLEPGPVLANFVEQDVLSSWIAAVSRFDVASTDPPEEYAHAVSRLREYAGMRTDAIRLHCAALREGDEAKAAEASELFAQARELQTTIVEDGLGD